LVVGWACAAGLRVGGREGVTGKVYFIFSNRALIARRSDRVR
jgi:hypothetical protein